MLKIQQDVLDFHMKFGHPYTSTPVDFTKLTHEQLDEWAKVLGFRMNLIEEEFDELDYEISEIFEDEMGTRTPPNIGNIAGEIVDAIYVLAGTATALGIDLEPVWDAIHKANMDKIPNGQEKPIKPEGWTPPNIRKIIAEQREN
jgi:predicted HAD superfamily Cof-like phosphohydrolase